MEKPSRFAGYYMKRRKWPLKGYHRRFIVLDDGWLKYGKNEEMRRAHGALDLGDAAIVKDKKEEIHIGFCQKLFIFSYFYKTLTWDHQYT